jgi:hypothetical protein
MMFSKTVTYLVKKGDEAMRNMAQTVLPFKLEATEELLTSNAGLALFGEFIRGQGFNHWVKKEMPEPGSGRGYEANSYLSPLVLMLTGGGRSLEDIRMLKQDQALFALLKAKRLPSSDAVGDWLMRIGKGAGYEGLDRINQRIVARRLHQSGVTNHTFDGDATQIIAEKHEAAFTYKGEQGYMPMVSHLAEAGVILHSEFRAGNVAPATENLEFIKASEARLPKGHRIAHVRLDSAGYQAEILNYCEETHKTFAIGGRLDRPTLEAIAGIPTAAWKHYPDADIAETLHSMGNTKVAFRLIVIKYNRQADLFNDQPKYHVIVSNRKESTEATMVWYRQRGEVSENGIKELKIGFGMERMPCGKQETNAAFFRIGVIAHNLFVLFKHSVLGGNWQKCKVATVRWRLFHIPGKVIHHAGALVLKVAHDFLAIFQTIRQASFLHAQAHLP